MQKDTWLKDFRMGKMALVSFKEDIDGQVELPGHRLFVFLSSHSASEEWAQIPIALLCVNFLVLVCFGLTINYLGQVSYPFRVYVSSSVSVMMMKTKLDESGWSQPNSIIFPAITSWFWVIFHYVFISMGLSDFDIASGSTPTPDPLFKVLSPVLAQAYFHLS